jgi:altronate dehydratase
MIGLGCEVNQLTLYGQKGIAAGKRHFNIQESGGSRKWSNVRWTCCARYAKRSVH